MPPNKYYHTKARGLEVKVIQSQHCIEVEGVQIELIYLFGHNTIHVYLEDKLILSSQIRVNQTQVNYSNLIEVAVNYYEREVKRKLNELRQEQKEENQKTEQEPKKDLKQYLIEGLTQIIE
jgi:hypothetical protein